MPRVKLRGFAPCHNWLNAALSYPDGVAVWDPDADVGVQFGHDVVVTLAKRELTAE